MDRAPTLGGQNVWAARYGTGPAYGVRHAVHATCYLNIRPDKLHGPTYTEVSLARYTCVVYGHGMTSRPTPLGERIRDLREEAGLSQEQLAAAADVRWATVYRIETGSTANPGWLTVIALATVLDANLEWLAYGNDVAAA